MDLDNGADHAGAQIALLVWRDVERHVERKLGGGEERKLWELAVESGSMPRPSAIGEHDRTRNRNFFFSLSLSRFLFFFCLYPLCSLKLEVFCFFIGIVIPLVRY